MGIVYYTLPVRPYLLRCLIDMDSVRDLSLIITLPKPEPVTGDVKTLKGEKVRKGGKGKEKRREKGGKNLEYLFRPAKVSC